MQRGRTSGVSPQHVRARGPPLQRGRPAPIPFRRPLLLSVRTTHRTARISPSPCCPASLRMPGAGSWDIAPGVGRHRRTPSDLQRPQMSPMATALMAEPQTRQHGVSPRRGGVSVTESASKSPSTEPPCGLCGACGVPMPPLSRRSGAGVPDLVISRVRSRKSDSAYSALSALESESPPRTGGVCAFA